MNISTENDDSSNSLNNLLSQLQEGDFEQAEQTLKEQEFTPDNFEEFTSWNESKYTRNCIAHSDEFELILLCWMPGQETKIHDHDDKSCWVKMISGHIQEDTFHLEGETLRETGKHILNEGDVTFANNRLFLHRLKNTSKERTLSLHLYMEPIKKCKIYNPKEDCFSTAEMVYDTEASSLAI